MADPQPTKMSLTRSFKIEHQQGISSNMLRTVESQGTSIQQGAIRIRNLSSSVTCSATNVERTRGSTVEEENTYLT